MALYMVIWKGSLIVKPPLGRALIEDSLLRFLLKKDYELEAAVVNTNFLFQPSFSINVFRQNELIVAIVLQNY